jgi:methylated-DNA-[protein]-cysteine S-methyltransferase
MTRIKAAPCEDIRVIRVIRGQKKKTTKAMNYFHDTFPTPHGAFSVALDENDAVVAACFGGFARLRKHTPAGELVRDPKRAATVRREIGEYFAGKRRAFTVKIAAPGTAFQQRAWAALRAIPFGETRSYGELAAEIGKPKAARAIGRANATNPVCLIVPCHRVIGSDGSLTGFAYGEALKRRLLEHEGAIS